MSVRIEDTLLTRSLWKTLAVIFGVIAIYALYLLLRPGTPAQINTVDNVVETLFETAGAILAFLPVRRTLTDEALQTRIKGGEKRSLAQYVPLLIGVGIASYALGQLIWTYNEDVLHLTVLFPSWADAGYLGAFPFILAGILLLPTRRLTGALRSRVILDSLMIMIAIITFSWYFVLGPTVLQGADTPFAAVLATAYPVTDLFWACCLLLLAMHLSDGSMKPVLLLLSVGLAIIIIGDTIYDAQELANTYNTGTILDITWPLGYMLLGFAAHVARIALSQQRSQQIRLQEDEQLAPPLWQALLPYAFLPAVGFLIILTWTARANPVLNTGVYIGAMLLICLVVARQVLTIIDNDHLLRRQEHALERLARANNRVEEQAKVMAQRNEQLEMGIMHLKDVQARLANGNLHARANLNDGELMPLAASLNLMADRLISLEQADVQYQQLVKTLTELCVSFERQKQGKALLLPPSAYEVLITRRLLLALGYGESQPAQSFNPVTPIPPINGGDRHTSMLKPFPFKPDRPS